MAMYLRNSIFHEARRCLLSPMKDSLGVPLVGVLDRKISLEPQGPYIHPNPLVQPKKTARKFKSKYANPKFKVERTRKVVKVDLPDFHKNDKDMTPEEIRTKRKEMGIQPHRYWNEKPVFTSSTNGSFDAYIPPEGDGVASMASKERALQVVEFVGKKGKSMMAVRKIRRYDEDFDLKLFAEEAQQLYIKHFEALARYDEKELHELVTERAFPMVVNEAKLKTIRWAFHGSLDPPKVVHVRETHVLTEDNIFAQVTVRFHTQQTLAVYDRFGRLIHGSETRLRDVLEYMVFEKHVSNVYGSWRIHDKIIPKWFQSPPTSFTSYRIQEDPEESKLNV